MRDPTARLTDRLAAMRDGTPVDGPADEVAPARPGPRALDRLSQTDQELLVTAAWFDLSPAEVAKVLGISGPTYAVRPYRARRRFRAGFEAAPDDAPALHPSLTALRGGRA